MEGESDRVALETLATRRGLDLAAAGVTIVAIGGAQALPRALGRFGPGGLELRLAGLCDAREEAHYRAALERAGLGSQLTRSAMERLGFAVCEEDLEDELIRALGTSRVEQVLAANGDLRSFRTLQKEPAWRGRRTEDQLRRFLASGARRKIRYARLLVEAVDLRKIPRPLDSVLAHATAGTTRS